MRERTLALAPRETAASSPTGKRWPESLLRCSSRVRDGSIVQLWTLDFGIGGALMNRPHPSNRSLAMRLSLSLAIASAVAEVLVWSFFGGVNGCGASSNAASRWIFGSAPLFFPIIAAVILAIAGVRNKWRGGTVVLAVVTAVGIGAVLEVLVFLFEYGRHLCGN